VLRVALVEDDPDQAELIGLWLEGVGHDCRRYGDGESFLRALVNDSFDVVLLDWMLPGIGGDGVVKRLREQVGWGLPVLFVTNRDREEDIVRALEAGTDDYMIKPLNKAETLARIVALDRRARGPAGASASLELAPFVLDSARRRIERDGEPVDLAPREFELAAFLLRNVGRLLSRRHILESVWGISAELNTRTVDTHVSRVRTKLGLTPEIGWRLSAVYQHGYRLERLAPTDS